MTTGVEKAVSEEEMKREKSDTSHTIARPLDLSLKLRQEMYAWSKKHTTPSRLDNLKFPAGPEATWHYVIGLW